MDFGLQPGAILQLPLLVSDWRGNLTPSLGVCFVGPEVLLCSVQLRDFHAVAIALHPLLKLSPFSVAQQALALDRPSMAIGARFSKVLKHPRMQ